MKVLFFIFSLDSASLSSAIMLSSTKGKEGFLIVTVLGIEILGIALHGIA